MNGIGTLNESTLHDEIKQLYLSDQFTSEVLYQGYYIDLYSESRLIEIQTQGFSSIRKKLEVLLKSRKVTLVYPLIVEKTIRVLNKTGKKILYERRSPKRGTLLHVCDEIMYIPSLLKHRNLIFEVLLVDVVEIRIDDGRGSWRRKGVSIVDRRLTNIHRKRHIFKKPSDFRAFLPPGITGEFSSRLLRQEYGVSIRSVNKLLYVLSHIGAITFMRFEGNLKIYAL